MKRILSRLGFNNADRGSALLVTLMLMVGVSLLGLGFVAISETESAISLNQRNHSQVLAVGEAGLRVAIEWFQDPVNANSIGILPANLEVFKTKRTTPTFGTNYYKTSGLLFDKPFRPNSGDRLYGTEDSADVIINDETDEGKKFLLEFNEKLFGAEDAAESCELGDGTAVRCARVSDVRVYAPPIVGGTLVDDGTGKKFWEGGIRYGYASIRLTAEKRKGNDIIARRTVRSVVSEWPFPGPQGPVQSNANISTAGNLGVHWGKMTAMGTIADSRPQVSLPWFDAHERIHYERGWDSSHQYANNFNYAAAGLNITEVHSVDPANGQASYQCSSCSVSRTFGEPAFTGAVGESVPDVSGAAVWTASTPYAAGDLVTPTVPAGYTYEAQAVGTSAATEPATWSLTPGGTTTDGTVTWKTLLTAMTWTGVDPANYPLSPTKPAEANDWLYELVADLDGDFVGGPSKVPTEEGKEIEDIWWEARARGDMESPSGVGLAPLHILKYSDPTVDEIEADASVPGGSGYWALYQGQDTTEVPEKKEVTFPRIDYEFWKEVAIQGNGTNRVFYLRWVGSPRDDSYSNGIAVKKVADWVNTDPDLTNPAEPGFYFFDTKNGVNPQITGGAASPYLTPELTLNSADANPLQMKGFIYLNTVRINFNGVSGIEDYYGYPGEPYRDVGVRQLDVSGDYIWDSTAKQFLIEGRNDGLHTCKDLNSNTLCDVALKSRTITRTDGGAAYKYTAYFPEPYSPTCYKAGNLADNTTGDYTSWGCSEPQEPFLNLRYKDPDTKHPAGDPAPSLQASWGAAVTTLVNVAKKKLPSGSLPTDCDTATPAKPEFCTSPRYDLDGGMMNLDPVMIGIMYNEGEYTATGNPRFFGSILINGSVDKAGTGQVYFDETLLKGTWQDQFDFPRVFESAHQTDK